MGLGFKEPDKAGQGRKGVLFRDELKEALAMSAKAEAAEKGLWEDRGGSEPGLHGSTVELVRTQHSSTVELARSQRKIPIPTPKTVRGLPLRSLSLTNESCDEDLEMHTTGQLDSNGGGGQMTDALEEQLTFQDDEELAHRNPFLYQFESSAMIQLLRNSYLEYKKLPVEERRKMDKVSHYASVFPTWVTEHPIFTSVDRVIRDRDTKEALSADPGNRSAKQLDRVALWLREMWARGKQTSPDELEALAHCVHFEVLKAGEMLASEGLIGYAMVIVVEGSVEGTSSMGKGTVVLGPGDSFGDAVLRTGKEVWERTLTARSNPTTILKVRKSALDTYGKDKKAMETHQAMRCFRTNPMFRGWPRSKLEKMCHMVQRKVYHRGDIIVRQDDFTDDVYFIIEGRCQVFKEVKLSSKNRWPTAQEEWEEKARTMLLPFKIMELSAGDYFGERAILRDTGRAATVVAAERTVCMALGKAEFLNMLQRGATVIESVYAQSNSYPTDEEVLTLFTALRIQRRHEGLIRASIKKTKEGFRPGDDDINVRKTDLKSRDVLTLPKRYGRLLDRSRERNRRESVIMSTESVKPEQTRRIVKIAQKLVSSHKALSKKDIKQMREDGKPVPSGFANEILRSAAATTSSKKASGSAGSMDIRQLSFVSGSGTHHSSIARYMRVQDSLPALITIKYKTTRPQLVPQDDKDPFSTVELSQMSTGVFMKMHAPSMVTPATR